MLTVLFVIEDISGQARKVAGQKLRDVDHGPAMEGATAPLVVLVAIAALRGGVVSGRRPMWGDLGPCTISIRFVRGQPIAGPVSCGGGMSFMESEWTSEVADLVCLFSLPRLATRSVMFTDFVASWLWGAGGVGCLRGR